MAVFTTFEVYVRGDGRWQKSQTFADSFKEDAIAFAKGLDREDAVEGARVMEVRNYGPDRSPVEVIAWISPHLAPKVKGKHQNKAGGKTMLPSSEMTTSQKDELARDAARAKAAKLQDLEADAETGVVQKAPPLEQLPKSKVASRFSMALALSAGLTIAALIPLRFLAQSLVSNGIMLNAGSAQAFIIMGLVLIFIIGAATFLPTVVGRENLHALFSTPPAEPETAPEEITPIEVPEDSIDDSAETPALFAPSSDEDHAANSDEDEQENSAVQQMSESNRVQMMRFLESTLLALKDDIPRMDQLTNFGLCLFLAGAGDRYGKNAELNTMQTFVIIREAIEMVGTPADRVDRFSANYADYLADPAFRTMIDAGREIMDRYLNDNTDAFRTIADTLRRWKQSPAAVARLSGILTVMFTDLVGSTSMTQQMGDYGAQRVVRAHNAIVRSALAAHHGEEVKHTGDGIMASFANAAQAVRATIQIQRGVARHAKGADALPLSIRIGLNAGDAVKEENDLYGTAVQLAARVCDKADGHKIYVTNSVVKLTSSQDFSYRSVGDLAMKGIDDPVPVFEVKWRP